jgi:hypothetical protein
VVGVEAVMEGERDATMSINTPEELDEGVREKLSASPKVKRIASPRWSKHETLVMIDAKRKHELELQKIRDWCKTNRVEDFWTMSGDERREKKLPTGFDQEVYQAMETFDNPAGLPDAFESGTPRGAADDGLFSEIDQDVHPVEEVQHLDNGAIPQQARPVEHGTGNGLRLPPVAPKPLLLTGTHFTAQQRLPVIFSTSRKDVELHRRVLVCRCECVLYVMTPALRCFSV